MVLPGRNALAVGALVLASLLHACIDDAPGPDARPSALYTGAPAPHPDLTPVLPADPLLLLFEPSAFPPLAACDASLCNDGNPCTSDFCSLTKGCLHRNLNRQPCEDGSACTVHDRCSAGACLPGFTKTCRDGDVCTADSCHPGWGCVYAPMDCADGNACTDDVCDPKLGCFFVSANGAPCSDGDPCTSDDFCAAKKCFSGTPNPCDDANPCTQDSCDPATGCAHTAVVDGSSCSNDDVCDGLELCAAGVCEPGAGLDCDDANTCTTDTCDPTAGCASASKPNGTACDDGDACTTAEKCASGVCGGGAAVVCDDENPCTDDTCAPASGCVYTNDDTNGCDDARVCTAADRCEAGACTGDYVSGCCESDAQCDDATACTTDTCDEPTGVCTNAVDVATYFADSFDDGSIADWAVASSNPSVTWQVHGAHTVSAPGALYLGNTAAGSYDFGMTDATATSKPITLPASSAPALSFRVLRLVDPAEFCPYDILTLQVGEEVVWQECGPGGAWVELDIDLSPWAGQTVQLTWRFETADPGFNQGEGVFIDDMAVTYAGHPLAACCDGGSDCDDGDPCTADVCEGLGAGAGFCAFVPQGVCCAAVADCEDGDPCTVDACVGGVCQTAAVAEGGACEDGDPCTAGEVCAGGVCGGGGPAICPDDGDPCTVEACDALLGCVAAPADCDDGAACTLDVCQAGAGCLNAPIDALCDDGDPCTLDACDDGACQHAALPDGASCATDACTVGATCQGGVCAGGGAAPCDDGNPCTVDACDPLAGCFYGAVGACDDGLSCTEDLCDPALGCVFVVSALTCADGNPCTADTCGPGGCASAPLADGVPCSDPCGGPGQCAAGVCVAAPSTCDDGDGCTDDWCDVTGCKHLASLTACDDGDPCTADSCAGGACVHEATDAACDDGDPCTADSCADGACVNGALAGGAVCDDGDPCTLAACLDGICVAFGSVGCDDGDPCTADTCDAGGCGAMPLCDDGDPCTADACDAGDCSYAPLGEGAACDDGDPCTAGSACTGGECAGGSPVAGCCATDADCAAPCVDSACVDGACVGAPAPGAWYRETFDDGAAQGWTFLADPGHPGFSVQPGGGLSTPAALHAPVDQPGPPSGQWVAAGAATPVVFVDPAAPVALKYALRTDWAADCGTWGSFVSVFVDELWVADECSTGGAWVERTLDLGGLVQPGAAAVQVRFEVWTLDVPGNGGDGAYIDDVALVSPGASACCVGDAACPGDDGNPCTAMACSDPARGGLCATRHLPAGTACGAGQTCLSGQCL